MTIEGGPESFGPYAFTFSADETEAATARYGLREALGGDLVVNHLAPFAAFVLVMAFAAILTLTGLIGRRAGRAVLILAAILFLGQRLANYWRMRRARKRARAAVEAMAAGAQSVSLDAAGVTRAAGDGTLTLAYAECEETEAVHGLIYFWPREGTPIVLPARVLQPGEGERILTRVRRLIGQRAPPAPFLDDDDD